MQYLVVLGPPRLRETGRETDIGLELTASPIVITKTITNKQKKKKIELNHLSVTGYTHVQLPLLPQTVNIYQEFLRYIVTVYNKYKSVSLKFNQQQERKSSLFEK